MTFKNVVTMAFSHKGKKYKRGDIIRDQAEIAGLTERHRHKRTVKVHMTPAEEEKFGTGAKATA
jgi:hypothetical protein